MSREVWAIDASGSRVQGSGFTYPLRDSDSRISILRLGNSNLGIGVCSLRCDAA